MTTRETQQKSAARDLVVKPITSVEQVKNKTAGRPARLEMPPLPKMQMTEVEQDLFNYFLESYKQEYPDLIPTDYIHLHLAAVLYIETLRVMAWELEEGRVISQARQHPLVQMRATLDQLSVTRRARVAHTKQDESDEEKELKDFFLSLSTPTPKKKAQADRPTPVRD